MSLKDKIENKEHGRFECSVGEFLDLYEQSIIRPYEHNRGLYYKMSASIKEMSENFNVLLFDVKGCIFDSKEGCFLKMADAHRRTFALLKYRNYLQKNNCYDELDELLNAKTSVLMRPEQEFKDLYEICSKQNSHSTLMTITNPDYNIGHWVMKIINDLITITPGDSLADVERKRKNARWLNKQKGVCNQIAYIVYNFPTIDNVDEWNHANIYYGKGKIRKAMFDTVDKKWLSKQEYDWIIEAFEYCFEMFEYLSELQPMVKRHQSDIVSRIGFMMYVVCDRLKGSKYVPRNECVIKWTSKQMARRIDVRFKKLEDLVVPLTGRTKSVSTKIAAEVDNVLLK